MSYGVFDKQPAGVIFIAPSLTTYTDKNPSFKIYESDAETREVTDWDTYRLDIPKANNNTSSLSTFEHVYTMTKLYGLSNLRPATLDKWARGMADNEKDAVNYLYNKETGGPGSPTSCDEGCRKSTVCSIVNNTAKEVLACDGSKPSFENKVLDYFFGDWVYKKY